MKVIETAEATAVIADYFDLICDTGYAFDESELLRRMNANAVDAEPVRNGKWIKADSQQYFRKHYPAFTCSECGQRKDSQKTWNYCPNCGADMRDKS